MTTRDPKEPNVPDTEEDLNLIPSWPPWLEGLTARGRIRAIVDAVARCYADVRPEAEHGTDGQHCTAAIAVMYLEALLEPGEAGQDEAVPAPEPAASPVGRLARCEVKGFRDLGVVRVTETTFAGEPMIHAERTPWSSPEFEGDAADFPASSLHFVTWLPERSLQPSVQERAAITSACHHPEGYYDQGPHADDEDLDDGDDYNEGGPF